MAEPRCISTDTQPRVTSQTYLPVASTLADEELIDQLTAERDRYAAMLLSAEQELAKRSNIDVAKLESYKQSYLLVVESRSWRMTTPLRIAGGLVRRYLRRRTQV